jgi:hypothetical protein
LFRFPGCVVGSVGGLHKNGTHASCDVLPLQEVLQNILTSIDEGRKKLAAEKMKRRNLQQRPDQHREQNLPEWLFFHFGPVIGVGIVALDHYRTQNHHPTYIQILSVCYRD